MQSAADELVLQKMAVNLVVLHLLGGNGFELSATYAPHTLRDSTHIVACLPERKL